MMRSATLWVLTAFAVGSAAADRAALDTIGQEWLKANSVPGVAVAVVENGTVTYSNGFGFADEEKSKPIKPETTFLIGSVTKQFTAGAIMLLVRDKKLKLDDSITLYLKEVPSEWKSVTVRHLLHHTSGIYSYTNEPGVIFSPEPFLFADILKVAKSKPLDFPPGERLEYNNTGYYFLGEIIARVSKKSYDVFMTDRIFKPLGMKNTYVYKRGKPRAGESLGFGEGFKPFLPPDEATPGAAGALASNVLDLAKWDAALRSNKLFTDAEKAQMWTPTKLNSGKTEPYGLGWVLTGSPTLTAVDHGGGIPGFTSHIHRFFNPNVTVIVLKNTMGGGPASTLAQALAEETSPALKARLEVKGITDSDPATTAYLEKTFREMLTGTPDTSRWAESLKTALNPDLLKQVRTQLAPLGALKSMTLIGREKSGARTVHSFVAEFEKAKLKAIAGTTDDGKLTDFLLQPYP